MDHRNNLIDILSQTYIVKNVIKDLLTLIIHIQFVNIKTRTSRKQILIKT